MTALPRLAFAALLGLAALLPGAARAGEETPVPPKPAPEAPATPAAPTETDSQLLDRITGEMAKKVEEIRGLRFKRPVERVWKSREEARVEAVAMFDDGMPPEKQSLYSSLFGFLGFLREGANVKDVFSDFISAGAGGYYQPKKQVFSLIRGFGEDASRGIVFHELVHAVEDQYYDFEARSERYEKEGLDDEGEALRAVVEGSARIFEFRFVGGEPKGAWAKYMNAQLAEAQKGDTMKKQMEIPPAILIAFQLYPYGSGSVFLGEVLAAAGEKGDDPLGKVYADPPTSTEQILHPAKYLGARDLPQRVRLRDLGPSLGEGWKRLGDGTMGELWTGLALNASLLPNTLMAQAQSCVRPPAPGSLKGPDDLIRFQLNLALQFHGETAKAAEGWDGDRYAVYAAGDRVALAWVSTWDGEGDATEFAEAYGKAIGKKYARKETVKTEDGKDEVRTVSPVAVAIEGGRRWDGTREGCSSAIVVQGERVLVAERFPSESLPGVLAALAKSEVVRDPKDAVPAR